jgi:hypothetical protein
MYVLCKYNRFEGVTETSVVGRSSNKIRPSVFTINMTISSVYIRNCCICIRKRSNESDAITLLSCKSAVLQKQQKFLCCL